jgi:hypothetical protein
MVATLKRTLTCQTCAAVSRIELMKQSLTELGYCPACGSADVLVEKDTPTDYFEQLEKTYNLPVFIIKELFATWNIKTHENFGKYIESFLEEVV